MAGTLVFVHGTGGRRPKLDQRWATITAAAGGQGVDATFVRVDWGDELGVTLDGMDAALPVEVTPDASFTPDPDGPSMWALLFDDPSFELRVLAESTDRPARIGVDVAAEAAALARHVAHAGDGDGAQLLARAGVTADELVAALDRVLAHGDHARAAAAVADPYDPQLVTNTARAVVAAAIASRRGDPVAGQPAAAFDRRLRMALVEHVEDVIVPGVQKGLGKWLAQKIGRFAMAPITFGAVTTRERWMGGGGSFVGDIVHYLRHGAAIRTLLARHLAGQPRPVVAVGHSLGGIALVDLLSGPDAPAVDMLVTVGSQAPLLHTLDALEHMRRDRAVEPFTPWHNVYDPNDLLSFCAERVFSDIEGVVDHELVSGLPFPWSHSAYFERDALWELVAELWPGTP